MGLAKGSRLGPYEILGLLGAGGMGEVYRARDARLGRDVAVKVLPASLSQDRERLRRFEQEARAAGALNHPNVVAVYDVGTHDGTPYVVSELLEGRTLGARMAGSRLPLRQCLDYALQVARGLAAAHAKGIVHRDLKPENVFVTDDGRVKILDFGLAKLSRPEPDPGLGQDPMLTAPAETTPGTVLGTVGYMAPEQVRGEATDHRSDIFSFGAILYEMLFGRRAFKGDTPAETMYAILTQDPLEPSDAINTTPGLSPALGGIVRHCLEKLPAGRFQSAADLCFAIETLSSASAPAIVQRPTPAEPRSYAGRGLAGWVAAGLLAVALVSLAVAYLKAARPDDRVFTASVLPADESMFGTLVVSPDGRWLAFTDTSSTGMGQLWIRTLDGPVVTTRALAGTAGASNPFWSPDSRSLGFFADSQLKIIDIAGGLPRKVTDVSDNRGGTWSRDGVIVFARDLRGPLYRVSALTGGTVTPVTQLNLDRQEGTHRWPQFLPDDKHFLYFVRSTEPEAVGTYLGSLDAPMAIRLQGNSTNAVFAPPGFLLFVRDGTLMAQRFDVNGRRLLGEPSALVPKVGFSLRLNLGLFSASANGVLVYGGSEDCRPVWFDRAGTAQAAVAPPGSYSHLWLSPDDARVAIERPDPRTGANDVVVIDLDRGEIPARFTTHPASDIRSMWMPTGSSIVWASNRLGLYDLYRKPVLGGGDEELLFRSNESKVPTDASPDGRLLFFESADSKARSTLWVLPLVGDKVPFRLLDSGFNEAQARVSPDGRWIAYTSDKDGTFDIYVVEAAVLPAASQPGTSRRTAASSSVRVSTSGGTQPLWRRDGKKRELYYLAPDRRLMAVSFKEGGRLQAGVPQAILETRVADTGRQFQNYVASADGQRFLILTRVEETKAATVVLNWARTLRNSNR